MGCKNNKQCHVTYFVLIWNVELDSIIILTFATTMRPISAAKHSSVLSLFLSATHIVISLQFTLEGSCNLENPQNHKHVFIAVT